MSVREDHDEWNEINLAGSGGETCLSEEIELTPPPSSVRRGESAKHWFRSERFFKVGGVWFFTTREGIDIGPYASMLEARKQLQQLFVFLRKTQTDAESRKVVYEFKHQPPQY